MATTNKQVYILSVVVLLVFCSLAANGCMWLGCGEQKNITDTRQTQQQQEYCDKNKSSDCNDKLTRINLRSKGITEMHEDSFKGMEGLNKVYLPNNSLTTLPKALFRHNIALQVVYITQNALTTIPAKIFENNVNIKRVYLRRNKLSKLPSRLLTKQPNLTTIILDSNQLKELPAGLFSSNPDIAVILLHHNQLKKLPARLFNQNTKLQYLDLSFNMLTKLSSSIFEHNTELLELNLDHNKLLHLPKSLLKLEKLQKLSIKENPLLNNVVPDMTAMFIGNGASKRFGVDSLREMLPSLECCPNKWFVELFLKRAAGAAVNKSLTGSDDLPVCTDLENTKLTDIVSVAELDKQCMSKTGLLSSSTSFPEES